jgi:hypothetical protein
MPWVRVSFFSSFLFFLCSFFMYIRTHSHSHINTWTSKTHAHTHHNRARAPTSAWA